MKHPCKNMPIVGGKMLLRKDPRAECYPEYGVDFTGRVFDSRTGELWPLERTPDCVPVSTGDFWAAWSAAPETVERDRARALHGQTLGFVRAILAMCPPNPQEG